MTAFPPPLEPLPPGPYSVRDSTPPPTRNLDGDPFGLRTPPPARSYVIPERGRPLGDPLGNRGPALAPAVTETPPRMTEPRDPFRGGDPRLLAVERLADDLLLGYADGTPQANAYRARAAAQVLREASERRYASVPPDQSIKDPFAARLLVEHRGSVLDTIRDPRFNEHVQEYVRRSDVPFGGIRDPRHADQAPVDVRDRAGLTLDGKTVTVATQLLLNDRAVQNAVRSEIAADAAQPLPEDASRHEQGRRLLGDAARVAAHLAPQLQAGRPDFVATPQPRGSLLDRAKAVLKKVPPPTPVSRGENPFNMDVRTVRSRNPFGLGATPAARTGEFLADQLLRGYGDGTAQANSFRATAAATALREYDEQRRTSVAPDTVREPFAARLLVEHRGSVLDTVRDPRFQEQLRQHVPQPTGVVLGEGTPAERRVTLETQHMLNHPDVQGAIRTEIDAIPREYANAGDTARRNDAHRLLGDAAEAAVVVAPMALAAASALERAQGMAAEVGLRSIGAAPTAAPAVVFPTPEMTREMVR